MVDCEAELKYYKTILDRYKEYIEKNESKTILELKYSIDVNDGTVKKIASAFMPQDYAYVRDFMNIVKKIGGWIKDIKTINPKIQAYLTFEEIVKIKAATRIDKILFLCSLLRYLGNYDAMVAITMDKPHLIFSFESVVYELDVESGDIKFVPNGDVRKYFDNKLIVMFNEKEYKNYDLK